MQVESVACFGWRWHTWPTNNSLARAHTSCLLISLNQSLVWSRKAQQHNTIMKRILLVVAVIALYALHQDFWFWRTSNPLVFGFIPIGLFYQACYSAAASLLMWLLVKYAWPAHLEREIEHSDSEEDALQ